MNTGKEKPSVEMSVTMHQFQVKDIDGKDVSLKTYKGKTLLIVNVASYCGYTPQYEGLQKIYEKYRDQGLVVLGFPANEFGKQEPGSDGQIKEFCEEKYQVTFPMFSKIVAKGAEKAPLYRYLTEEATNPKFSGEIRWNFTKFLVNGRGEIVDRFESGVAPESEKMTGRIEEVLTINKEQQLKKPPPNRKAK